jgi:hypothetical protein
MLDFECQDKHHIYLAYYIVIVWMCMYICMFLCVCIGIIKSRNFFFVFVSIINKKLKIEIKTTKLNQNQTKRND